MGIAELLFPTFDPTKAASFCRRKKKASSHANEPIYLNIMFYINLSFSFVSFELIFLPSTPITTPANIFGIVISLIHSISRISCRAWHFHFHVVNYFSLSTFAQLLIRPSPHKPFPRSTFPLMKTSQYEFRCRNKFYSKSVVSNIFTTRCNGSIPSLIYSDKSHFLSSSFLSLQCALL